MRDCALNLAGGISRRGNFGTPLRQFATLLLILPCAAQNPPGVLYSTTIPNSNGISGGASVSATSTDAAGNTYVTGSVSSNGLMSTPGVVQPSFAGGNSDAFIAKFNSTGTLLFLTYLGGSGADAGNSIAIDSSGDIYIAGTTNSMDFPSASLPVQPPYSNGGGVFIAKLSSDGKKLIWSTQLLAGSGLLALAPDGSLYVPSEFVVIPVVASMYITPELLQLTPNGQLAASINFPPITAIAAGADGSLYVGGMTNTAAALQATPGAWMTTFAGPSEGFVAKLNPGLSGFAWATYTGTGSAASQLIVASDGSSLWATGSISSSTNFPVTGGALQSQSSPYDDGGFLVRLSTDGSRALAATYLPAPPSSLALDPSGDLIVSALYAGGVFQATPGAPWPCGQSSAYHLTSFIGRIDAAAQHVLWGTGTPSQFAYVTSDNQGNALAAGDSASGGIILMALDTTSNTPHLLESCIAPSDGGPTGPLAPGELFSIYGADYGPAQGVVAQSSGGAIGTSLGGIQVLVEDTPVPLLYVSAAQINAVAPFLLYGRTAAHIKIVTASATSNEVVLGVRNVEPEIFAISNQDGTQNTQMNPAHAGDFLSIWASGLGQTNPPGVDGAIPTAAGGTPLLPIILQLATVQSPNLEIPGPTPPPPVSATVLYAGNAPGLVSGVTQINFELPVLPLPLPSETPVFGPPYAATVTLTAGGVAISAYLWFEIAPPVTSAAWRYP